ncbi:MAG: hypothetical protein HY363_06315 [Candidatus Aenigmarchaeota archaeon]|nr:hypothetical protein [Candidatus Aenigmarchaeota archaeon]
MLNFDTKYGLVPKEKLPNILAKLKPVIEHMRRVSEHKDYSDDYSSINLAFDNANIENARLLARKYSKADAVVVIGIGGSNLGTMAVQEGLFGKLWNSTEWKPKVFYADTVDPNNIGGIIHVVESMLLQGKEVLINIVSKSGTITEIIANAQIFISLLSTHGKDASEYVVVTTDRNSKLWNVAKQCGLSVLEIPQKVGGRYSVLSAVGLFPLAVAGIDVEKICAGAAKMRDICLQENNIAAISAAHLYYHHKNKKKIHDTFLFSTDLESLGNWYRQLMAESLGKRQDVSRKIVNAGMTPIVSIGTTDLHSMFQLYMGGPVDKFTTFVTVDEKKDITVTEVKAFNTLVPEINKKKLGEIRNAAAEGVMHCYKKNKLPFVHIHLPARSEETIGAFLQMKMMEVMFLGRLWNVNAFDQPEVEKYKAETRKILGR